MKVCIGWCILPVTQPQSFMVYQKFIKLVPPLGQKYLAWGSVTYWVANVITKVFETSCMQIATPHTKYQWLCN